MDEPVRAIGPDFREQDCYPLLRILRTWVEVRDKAGYRWPESRERLPFTEMWKSRLLLWLFQGNEPLPLPPPLYLSGPQHRVEVDGDTGWYMDPPVVAGETSVYPTGSVIWLFSDPWTLVRREGDDWILTMPEHLTGTWRITPETEKRAYVSGSWADVHGWHGRREPLHPDGADPA